MRIVSGRFLLIFIVIIGIFDALYADGVHSNILGILYRIVWLLIGIAGTLFLIDEAAEVSDRY